MPVWRRPRALLALVITLGALNAGAQTTLHVSDAVSVGYTDNAFGAPDSASPGQERSATPLLLVAPGVLLNHESPNARYVASYARLFSFFLAAPERDTAADQAELLSFFTLSPLDTLSLGVHATHASFASLLGDAAFSSARETRARTDFERLRADLAQRYGHEFSQRWRLLQAATAGVLLPLESRELEPLRYSLGASLALEHQVGHDAYRVEGSAGFFRSASLEASAPLPSRRAVLGSAGLRWGRAWGPRWSSELAAGLSAAHGPHGETSWAPLGSASLEFSSWATRARLEYRHGHSVSLESSSVLVRDELSLQAALDLDRKRRWVLRTSHAVAHARDVAHGSGEESVNLWASELSVERAGELVTLGLRAAHFQQFGASHPLGQLPNRTTNAVLVGARGVFPPRRPLRISLAPPRRVDDRETY